MTTLPRIPGWARIYKDYNTKDKSNFIYSFLVPCVEAEDLSLCQAPDYSSDNSP